MDVMLSDSRSSIDEIASKITATSLINDNIVDVLNKALDNPKTNSATHGACLLFKSLVARLGVHFEPFAVPLLPKLVAVYDIKSADTRDAASAAATALIDTINPGAVRLVLPALFVSIKASGWREKVGALDLLRRLSKHARGKVGMCLPEIVPEITDCLWDTKKETQRAAIDALTEACAVIENLDIRPIVPVLISANARPEECPACVDRLMAVVFVQTVDAPTLSIIVPILARGLRNRDEQLKRKCCVVIDNMCKLVMEPRDAAPFGPKLRPELVRAADECANEEVRQVAMRALQTLDHCLH